MQYTMYVPAAAQAVLGLSAGDRLLLAVAFETLWAHPRAAMVMGFQSLTFLGFQVEGMVRVISNPLNANNWLNLFPFWSVFDWARIDFNAGGCAAAALPSHMWDEYRWDQSLTATAFSDRAIELAAFGRNLVRAVCGGVVLLGWWLLFIAPRRGFALTVLFSMGALMFAIGVLVGSSNGKYDLAFIPLLVIAAVSIATEALRRLWR